jgi:hypothetical protein
VSAAPHQERRKLHPEVDDYPTCIPPGDVHPKQQGVRYFPEQHCPCKDAAPLCGGPRVHCPVHDPVVAEGDWDA